MLVNTPEKKEVSNILNERHIKILDILNGYKETDVKFLSEKLYTIPKTIRYDIKNLNYYLKKYKLPIIEDNKYLRFQKGFNLESFLKNMEVKDYKFSERERIEFIVIRILFNTQEKLTTEKLAFELGVSELTIKKDLKILREEIKDRELALQFDKKKGFLVTGDEEKIRQKQLKYYVDYNIGYSRNNTEAIPDFLKFEIKKILTDYRKNIDTEDLYKYVENLSGSLDRIVSNEAHEVLVLYIMILVKRLQAGSHTEEKPVLNEYLLMTKEYEVISNSINELESKYKISIHKNEVLKIVDYLLGSHTYNFDYSFYENWVETEILVRKIINEVDKYTEVEITKDELLFEGLLNHIKPTIYRIKNNIFFPGLVLEEIINTEKELLEIVGKSLADLENYIGCKISNIETALFTVHFKLAIERAKEKQVKIYRILLVCSTGYATSNLLSQQLSAEYNIEIADLIPYYKVFDYDLSDIDLIISNIDIEKGIIKKNINIIKVGVVLSDSDRENLRNTGVNKRMSRIKLTEILEILNSSENFQNMNNLGDSLINRFGGKILDDREDDGTAVKERLSSFLTLGNIMVSDKKTDWIETVNTAGGILLKNGYINEGYIKNIIGNINKNGVYMVLKNEFILLHAEKQNNVFKTGIAFLRKKFPVEFPGKYMVRNILAISCHSKEELSGSFEDILKLSENTGFLEELEDVRDSEAVFCLIKKYTEI